MLNILIPMAGLGQRFIDEGFTQPKPLIDINGTPMIVKAIESLGMNGNLAFILKSGPEIDKILTQLLSKFPGCKIFMINELTDGPACTCLVAKHLIDNDDELVIANCDQIMWWNSGAFEHFCKYANYDGMVVTYTSDVTKNSYARIDRLGYVQEIKEKEVISDISLNGIHYWKKGKDFVKSAEQMIEQNDRAINGEFYVAPTYNYMIQDNKRVGIYHIPNCQHHAVGTPDDLREYMRHEST
jgi:NDP-sugar pyrophosphorylase family protein